MKNILLCCIRIFKENYKTPFSKILSDAWFQNLLLESKKNDWEMTTLDSRP